MSSISSALDRVFRSVEAVRNSATDSPVSLLTDAQLMSQFNAAAEMRKAVDSVMVALSAEVAARSPHGPGVDSLARRAGFSSSVAMISETAGINPAEASKVVRVAEATSHRVSVSGEVIPARYEHTSAAMAAGALNTEQADIITRSLDAVRTRADGQLLDQVEQTLVELAPTLRFGDLRKVCDRARQRLDPDGIEPTEQQQRDARVLRFANQNGMTLLTWLMPNDQAVLVKAGIDTVARQLGRGSTGPQPEPAIARREANKFDLDGNPLNAGARQLCQLRADAAFAIFDHTATCTNRDPGLPSFHAVVRVDLDALRGVAGSSATAQLDGIDAGISAGLARRLAAKAQIIPAVMGSGDVPLNLGAKSRLFSSAQRTALIERDGACAWPGCESSPAWSDAHHLAWWAKDGGATDLNNGIMLCSSHHHRVHDNGWQIEFDDPADCAGGTQVPWFIPPPEWVAADPSHRTRLQGGNPIRRFDRALERELALACAA